jgi:hypothetical protein
MSKWSRRARELAPLLAILLCVALSSPPRSSPRGVYAFGQIVRYSSLLHDSTYFDADGYYFPTESVAIDGYRLDSMSFDLFQFRYGFYSDSVVYAPEVMLLLCEPGAEDSIGGGYVSDSTLVTPDHLVLRFSDTPIGTVRYIGSFADKEGRFWEDRVTPFQTVILRGRLSVARGSRVTVSRPLSFTFWEGD